MHFRITTEPWVLRSYVQELVGLAGRDLWERRTDQLCAEAAGSPFQDRVVSDYHWVELQLRDELSTREFGTSATATTPADPFSLRALRFAQTTIEVHRALSRAGKRVLEGRLRDALQAKTGFAALFHEMETAAVLISQGFDVDFPDLNGEGRCDLAFRRQATVGEIECKSLSADAGRKIHRKDFYRFMDAIGSAITLRATGGANEVIRITINDRLTSNLGERKALEQATQHLLRSHAVNELVGDDFTIIRESRPNFFDAFREPSAPELYSLCQRTFGENCHVSGVNAGMTSCLIVMRSKRPDDHSKPQLEAMQKASTQLSPDRPGFIALQYNDISSRDLILPHVRRRTEILSQYLFRESGAPQVAAVHICAFGSLATAADNLGRAGVVFWNPCFLLRSGQLPFQRGVPEEAFTRLLNRPWK